MSLLVIPSDYKSSMSSNYTEAAGNFTSFSEEGTHFLYGETYSSTMRDRAGSLANTDELSLKKFSLGATRAQPQNTNQGLSENIFLYSDFGVVDYNTDPINAPVGLIWDCVRRWLSPEAVNKFAKYQERIDNLRLEAELEGLSINPKSEDGLAHSHRRWRLARYVEGPRLFSPCVAIQRRRINSVRNIQQAVGFE